MTACQLFWPPRECAPHSARRAILQNVRKPLRFVSRKKPSAMDLRIGTAPTEQTHFVLRPRSMRHFGSAQCRHRNGRADRRRRWPSDFRGREPYRNVGRDARQFSGPSPTRRASMNWLPPRPAPHARMASHRSRQTSSWHLWHLWHLWRVWCWDCFVRRSHAPCAGPRRAPNHNIKDAQSESKIEKLLDHATNDSLATVGFLQTA
jgi:hypothetical protein